MNENIETHLSKPSKTVKIFFVDHRQEAAGLESGRYEVIVDNLNDFYKEVDTFFRERKEYKGRPGRVMCGFDYDDVGKTELHVDIEAEELINGEHLEFP